ncbi:hypothetical protein [Roseobacter sp. HKCCA0434]|uniref:hypothetical protein n=1 Tax=Roseobacter sp. HKCCA0434 TaxID=3079297 RepID=UPI002905B284|nr:hypothetical protein [Roseobacter sp. HKCCA0434]
MDFPAGRFYDRRMPHTDPLHTISISPARRWLGTGVMALLGVMLLSVVILQPPGSPWALVVLIGAGGIALWQARRLARAGLRSLILTEDAIVTDEGDTLTTYEGIDRIERGIFAFKPSNGFVLILDEPRPRTWVPGLYWQSGRRLGVGGTARAQDTKIAADLIETILAKRAGADL